MLLRVLAYAASLVPEIADDVLSVDTAMKLGYNWKFGPFEMIDAIGAEVLMAELQKDGLTLPPLLTAQPFYKTENGKQNEDNTIT